MYSTPYSCQTLIKLQFYGQIFEKYSNTKFRENPSNSNRVVPCGRTDRNDEVNSRFFRNFANSAENDYAELFGVLQLIV